MLEVETAKRLVLPPGMARAAHEGRKTQHRCIVGMKDTQFRFKDLLYVAEDWAISNIAGPSKFIYRCDYDPRMKPYNKWEWNSAWSMSIDAARTLLQIEDITYEHLQDIRGIDAIQEGVQLYNLGDGYDGYNFNGWDKIFYPTASEAYLKDWNKRLGKANKKQFGAKANPEVKVLHLILVDTED